MLHILHCVNYTFCLFFFKDNQLSFVSRQRSPSFIRLFHNIRLIKEFCRLRQAHIRTLLKHLFPKTCFSHSTSIILTIDCHMFWKQNFSLISLYSPNSALEVPYPEFPSIKITLSFSVQIFAMTAFNTRCSVARATNITNFSRPNAENFQRKTYGATMSLREDAVHSPHKKRILKRCDRPCREEMEHRAMQINMKRSLKIVSLQFF